MLPQPAKQSNLELLYAPTAQKMVRWLKQVEAEFPQFDVRVLETRRTYQRQAWLFGQGRTAAQCQAAGIEGAWANPNANQVTWRMDSLHRFDLAMDFALVRVNGPGSQDDDLTWLGQTYLNVLAKVVPEKFGLRSLARIGDYGHLEDLNALSLIHSHAIALR
jgi:hypothetical protein